LGLSRRHREIDVEARAHADAALDRDAATMLGDHAMHDGESQTGAFADMLVVKNGWKTRNRVASSMPQPVSRTER